MSDFIQCPKCKTDIDVRATLSRQIRAQLEGEMKQIKEDLALKEQAFEEKKKKENELFLARLEEKKKEIRSQVQAELEEKSRQQTQAKDHELTLLRLEKQKQEEQIKAQEEQIKQKDLLEKQKISTALEQQRTELLKSQHQQIELQKRTLEEQFALKEKEYQQKLTAQEELSKEMLRKQQQGSMQLQGEAQELLIEEMLRQAFPEDLIKEVKKGARGADCIQYIKQGGVSYGKICYESKRVQNFSDKYISKLKADVQREEADIGVLITNTLPKEMKQSGEKDGIWICTLSHLTLIAQLLRRSIIEQKTLVNAQENKGSKMKALYGFLTSQQFREYVENFIKVFASLEKQWQKEEEYIERQRKDRRKLLQKAQNNLIEMYGKLHEISQGAVRDISIQGLNWGALPNASSSLPKERNPK